MNHANPPTNCDLCQKAITDEFSDARIPGLGCWANVCPSCAKLELVRYGTGRGQRYQRVSEREFRKIEG